jgi:hypothetical protein
MSGLEPLGKDVRRQLDRLGPAGKIADVTAAWPAAVGEAIAANAWPARIGRDGTLHVATSSSAWAFELTQLADTVQGRLQEALGTAAPHALRFAPGRLPEAGAPPEEERERTVPRPSRAARAAAAEMAAEVEDSELRQAVARAVAAGLAAREEKPSDRRF